MDILVLEGRKIGDKMTKIILPNSDITIYKRESSYGDSLDTVITLFEVTDKGMNFEGEYTLYKIDYIPLFNLYSIHNYTYKNSFTEKQHLSQNTVDFGNDLRKILINFTDEDRDTIVYTVDTLEDFLKNKLISVSNRELREKVNKMTYKYSQKEMYHLGIALLHHLNKCYSIPTLENCTDLSISWGEDDDYRRKKVAIVDTPNSLGVQSIKIVQGNHTDLYYLKGSTIKDQYCNLLEEIVPLFNEYLIVIYYLLLMNQKSLEYRLLKESLKIMTSNENVSLCVNDPCLYLEIKDGVSSVRENYIKLSCILKGESPQSSVYQILLSTCEKFFPVGEYIVDYIGFNYFLAEVLRDFNTNIRLHKLTIDDLVLKLIPSLARATFNLFKEEDYILDKEDISSTIESTFTKCIEYRVDPEDDKVYCHSVHISPDTGTMNAYRREVDLETTYGKFGIEPSIVKADVNKLEYLKENNNAVKKIFKYLDNQESEK